MVNSDGNFLPLVQNHIIYGGCLVTENGEVERDYQGNVIPKPLIWDPQEPLIIHNAEGWILPPITILTPKIPHIILWKMVTIS